MNSTSDSDKTEPTYSTVRFVRPAAKYAKPRSLLSRIFAPTRVGGHRTSHSWPIGNASWLNKTPGDNLTLGQDYPLCRPIVNYQASSFSLFLSLRPSLIVVQFLIINLVLLRHVTDETQRYLYRFARPNL